MRQGLYEKEIKCPVCNNTFNTLKTRTNATFVLKKDEDFCTHYKDINPMFYEIYVCPNCGYSASENSFDNLSASELSALKDSFSGRQVNRSFCEERSINDAIDSFKLALFTAKVKRAKDSIIAGICLKIAWLYRMDEDEKELQFLNFALDNYMEAYNREEFPIGNLNEITMMYLLGELSRRVGKLKDAAVWLSRVITSPDKAANPRILGMAKEQFAIVKEQNKIEANNQSSP